MSISRVYRTALVALYRYLLKTFTKQCKDVGDTKEQILLGIWYARHTRKRIGIYKMIYVTANKVYMHPLTLPTQE